MVSVIFFYCACFQTANKKTNNEVTKENDNPQIR